MSNATALLRLGALDQAPIREGATAADAIRESLLLAQHVEQLGFHRFWLAEHHNSTGLACAAPEVLIPHIAAHTSTLRVGSGGVMLTHYSALKVAEQFRMLETLYPGRIDLGLGRAPGSDGLTAQALADGRGMLPLEMYPQQIDDLVRYLADELPEDHPFLGIHAMPAGEGMPEIWVLGSSLDSAVIAAKYGLPFSFAHFINPELGTRAVDLYRTRYQPSRWFPEPRVSAGVVTVCAPTEEEALRLSWSRYCWRFRRGAIPPVETALAFEYSPAELEYIEYSRSRSAVGDPTQVREKLEALARELGAEELILLTTVYDFAHRLRSYELVAEAFELEAPPN
jgi:luciferase family oxidoreductase group 1